jgi:hypothetical protein
MIKHRLVANEVMLGIALPVLLKDWKLTNSDVPVVEETWYTTAVSYPAAVPG